MPKLYEYISWNTFEKWRRKHISRLVPCWAVRLADVGCRTIDENIKSKCKEYYPIDIEPKEGIIYGDVHKLKYEDKYFDVIVCSEVLEHVDNPIEAMHELRRITKKLLIISVPYEPYFSIFRGLTWEKSHKWAIRPEVFHKELGKPTYEYAFILKRYYLMAWEF